MTNAVDEFQTNQHEIKFSITSVEIKHQILPDERGEFQETMMSEESERESRLLRNGERAGC